MSIPGLIYIIGGVVTFILVARLFLRDSEGDMTLNDLALLAVVCFLASLLSWFMVAFMILNKYGDKVVIRRKEDRK